jgi:hypothetical protein
VHQPMSAKGQKRVVGSDSDLGHAAAHLNMHNHAHTPIGATNSIQDTTASGGISGRLSITLSTKPKSLAISDVIK